MATRSLAILVVVGCVTGTFLITQTTAGMFVVVPWSVLIGEAVTLAWLAYACLANPLNCWYLQRYSTHEPLWIRVDELSSESQCDGLPRDYVYIGSFHDRSHADAPVRDVLRSADERILAVIGREQGTVTLLSRLNDRRIVVTDEMLVPPNVELVVNWVRGDVATRLRSHLSVLDEFATQGRQAGPVEIAALTDVDRLERHSYRQLGSVLAVFCNIDSERGRYRPLLEPDSQDILLLAYRTHPPRTGADETRETQPPVLSVA